MKPQISGFIIICFYRHLCSNNCFCRFFAYFFKIVSSLLHKDWLHKTYLLIQLTLFQNWANCCNTSLIFFINSFRSFNTGSIACHCHQSGDDKTALTPVWQAIRLLVQFKQDYILITIQKQTGNLLPVSGLFPLRHNFRAILTSKPHNLLRLLSLMIHDSSMQTWVFFRISLLRDNRTKPSSVQRISSSHETLISASLCRVMPYVFSFVSCIRKVKNTGG